MNYTHIHLNELHIFSWARLTAPTFLSRPIFLICRPTLYTWNDTQTLYLAVLSIVSYGAGAAVGAQAISAGASVLAGLRVALIMLILTECPVKPRTTTAREGVDLINASPIIQTGAGGMKTKKVVINLSLCLEC